MVGEFKNKYDLEDRTANFGVKAILFCKTTKINDITKPLINQFIRSATSIGANYMEANGASSKKDFKNKIFICKKEAQESKHWCKMFNVAVDNRDKEINILMQEAKELAMIFHAIATKVE